MCTTPRYDTQPIGQLDSDSEEEDYSFEEASAHDEDGSVDSAVRETATSRIVRSLAAQAVEESSSRGGRRAPHRERESRDTRSTQESQSADPTPAQPVLIIERSTNGSSDNTTASTEGRTPDVLVITLKGKLNNEEGFLTRLEAALLCSAMVPYEHAISPAAERRCISTPQEIQRAMKRWSAEADNALLDFINSELKPSEAGLMGSLNKLILPRKMFVYSASCLSSFTLLEVQCRMLVLEQFNRCLETILPLVNLQSTDPLSLGATLRRCSRYVFMSIKEPMLEKALQATAAPSGTSGVPAALVLDNMKALTSRDKNQIDLVHSQSCFAQAFRQLREKDSVVYRYIFSGDRVFSINFHGESGIDAGGVFREGVSRIVEDLFSPHFNLLLLCPNGQHETHINLDKYVPNPAHTGPLALEMFEFMGRLMAMSLRAKLSLPFELPSIVWKQLVGEEVVLDDLMAIDAITCHLLKAVQNCEEDGITNEDIFEAKYGDKLKWCYNGSDGLERELKKGSTRAVVTFHTRMEWCEAVTAARLGEFSKQVAAIQRGMDSVVPIRVLQLFSWQQLEVLVSGDPSIDVEVWKSFTDSSGLPSKTTQLFWKVMETLSPKEHSGFIRFAWGRSRLPPAKDFSVKMKLTRLASGPGGHRLPVAHTCFFSVELPDYSTEEEMRHGLLTAITYGVGGVLLG